MSYSYLTLLDFKQLFSAVTVISGMGCIRGLAGGKLKAGYTFHYATDSGAVSSVKEKQAHSTG